MHTPSGSIISAPYMQPRTQPTQPVRLQGYVIRRTARRSTTFSNGVSGDRAAPSDRSCNRRILCLHPVTSARTVFGDQILSCMLRHSQAARARQA